MTKLIAPGNDAAIAETIARFGRLLKELNITSAFYVDDYNCLVEFPMVSGMIKTLIDKGEGNKVKEALGEAIDLELPETDIILDDFSSKWEDFDNTKRIEVFKQISALDDSSFSAEDFERTMQLKSIFPDKSLSLISPDEWKDKSKELEAELKDNEKVLLIFDQDLTRATHEDFKSGRVKGDDLIVEVKKSSIWDKSYCTLITHVIESVPKEFEKRKTIASENKGGLQEKDFFALSKKRNENPELLCDGIKKAILDRYFELIKIKSVELIKEAQGKVIEEINKIDTYDFDQSILISSVEEGVWEVETLLRVANIIHDDSIKKLMIEKKYSEEVNPSIKKAKKISDIRFEIPSDIYPYKDSDEIRRSEIYLKAGLLNPLNSPIENGDIFEVFEGSGIGTYILLGQECDLVIRKDGSRESKFGNLCKIEEKLIDDVIQDIHKFAEKNGVQNHYLFNKFILDYFKESADTVGVINFKKPILADLNALDLVVFNTEGTASTVGLSTTDINILSHSWERRLKKLIAHYEAQKKELSELYQNITGIPDEVKQKITQKLNQPFSLGTSIGISIPFDGQDFKFGIKRIKRLRIPFSKNMLDKYAKYLARIADSHDFAK
ncbi:MAG: hypothetical protein KF862_19680 [Chitinophagaceae bacterium]|nr:hypothetical protein [Chitinophagaceae bacterium]